jgi:type I restriction enzyme S subunit
MSEEKPWSIPNTWSWVQISDLGKIVSGGTPSTKEPSYWGDEINWITPADLSGYRKKFISKGTKSLTQNGLNYSSANLMPSGSVHFSSRAPIGYVVISKETLSTNQGFKSLIPFPGAFNEYVYYYLKSAKQLAESRASGTTFKEISGKAFSGLPIPFPPLAEQHRIVAKIEELFSDLDAGIKSLKKAAAQLKRYRQAVLKYAFEGNLTRQWRKQQGQALEPAVQLLKTIKKEREAKYREKMVAWEQAVAAWQAKGKVGKKPAKPRPIKELPPLTEEELKELPELPEGWMWVKVVQLAQSMKNGIYKQANFYSLNGIPCLRMYNIENGKIKWIEIKRMILKNKEIEEYELRPNDLLVNRVNSRELVGKTALITNKFEKCVFESKNIRLRLMNLIKGEYVNYWFLIYANNYFISNAQQTVGMASINQDQLGNMPIPLISSLEQHQIVSEIESRLSVCDKLEEAVTESLKKAESLRQSILKKAFSGQLVPQDPNDEPAHLLLARIKKEKEKIMKDQKKKINRRKKP